MKVAVRWVPALVVGALWWWAALRLLTVPGEAGVTEGAMVVGGWGLSLLPVHVVGPVRVTGSVRGGDSARASGPARVEDTAITRASRRRRSGGGSGPS
ncbi:hypothetical protein [Streptomyces sp. CBMA152]|uniref:hypothetical protein n=1 Tax=Streptomyces sp. CBMA152 TaxID=1896312 RepID=UPI0016600B15|nr:hypothetical protein [Streptomyces sp. CBMA152]